jgi:hypothetical protein
MPSNDEENKQTSNALATTTANTDSSVKKENIPPPSPVNLVKTDKSINFSLEESKKKDEKKKEDGGE